MKSSASLTLALKISISLISSTFSSSKSFSLELSSAGASVGSNCVGGREGEEGVGRGDFRGGVEEARVVSEGVCVLLGFLGGLGSSEVVFWSCFVLGFLCLLYLLNSSSGGSSSIKVSSFIQSLSFICSIKTSYFSQTSLSKLSLKFPKFPKSKNSYNYPKILPQTFTKII